MSVDKLLFFGVRGLPVPRPANDRGDRLDRDATWLVHIANARDRDLEVRDRTVEQARADFHQSCRLVHGPLRPMKRVVDGRIAGRRVRTYDPGARAQGTLLYFHGGGWVVGDLDTHDHLCRRLAADGPQRVVAVDYRRAPEHPFPAAVQDAVAVYRAIAAEEGERVAVCGDSAGGNLAAVLCQVVRDEGDALRPAFQLLVYPATDLRRVTASHRALEHGYLLEKENLDWYQDAYAPDVLDPLASPRLHPDLTGLPPAVVVSAGFDPLRDDAELYADALARRGVEVEDLRFPGQLHGFANMDGVLPSADRAVQRIIVACRRRWAAIGGS